MIVQFIDLVMENGGTCPFKIIFDNKYNKYEEYWEEPEVLTNEVPVAVEEEIF